MSASPDNTRVQPPAPGPTFTDAAGVAWSIASTGLWVLRDGKATNGHATELLWHGGEVYAKSPTGGVWWKWLGNNRWQMLTTADPVPVTPPPVGLSVTLDFGGGQVANFSGGTDLGDFVGEFVHQKCFLALDPAFPDWRVYFRPDADGLRDEVVVEYGRSIAGTPVNRLTPYTATIRKGGSVVYTYTVPVHFWYARWRYQSSQRPVVRTPATLKARKWILNFGLAGTFGSAQFSNTITWGGPFSDPVDTAPNGNLFYPYMAAGGDHDQIGYLTEPAADYMIRPGASALTTLRTEGEWFGNAPTHIRDDVTGGMLDVVSGIKKFKDNGGTINHQVEPPVTTQPAYVYVESSHMYPCANAPWMLTDDPFFLEEIQFTVNWSLLGWGNKRQSDNLPGCAPYYEGRDFSWCLRDMLVCAASTPVSTPIWLQNRAYWTNCVADCKTLALKYVNSTAKVCSIFRMMTRTDAQPCWMRSWLTVICFQAWQLGLPGWQSIFTWAVDPHIQFTNGTSGWPRDWPAPYYYVPDTNWFPRQNSSVVWYPTDNSWDATTLNNYAELWNFYKSGSNYYTDAHGYTYSDAGFDGLSVKEAVQAEPKGVFIESYTQDVRSALSVAVDAGIAQAQSCYEYLHTQMATVVMPRNNSKGKSRISIDPITGGSVPTIPSNVQASDGITPVTVNWGASQNTIRYDIYRSIVSGQRGSLVGSTTNVGGFVDTPPDTSVYYYTVIASNDVGPSADSNQDAGSLAPIVVGPGSPTDPVGPGSPTDPIPPTGSNVIELVGTNKINSLDPDPAHTSVYHAILGQIGVLAYSGMAVAPNLGAKGSLIIHGGGDGDYWGNEVYAFDLATYVWTRLMLPSTALTGQIDADPSFDKIHCEYSDGSVGSAHTYNHLSVIPGGTGNKGLLLVGMNTWAYGHTKSGWSHVCDLGASPATWSRFSANEYLGGNIQVPAATCYDASRNRVWAISAGGWGTPVSYLDLATKMWSNVATPGATYVGGAIACQFPVNDLMLMVGAFGGYQQPQTFALYAINLANPSHDVYSLPLTGYAIPPNLGDTMTVDWDYDLNVGYMFANITGVPGDRGHVYKITPPATNILTNAWAITQIALPSPFAADQSAGIFSRWRYCASIKKFAMVTKTTDLVALYTP